MTRTGLALFFFNKLLSGLKTGFRFRRKENLCVASDLKETEEAIQAESFAERVVLPFKLLEIPITIISFFCLASRWLTGFC